MSTINHPQTDYLSPVRQTVLDAALPHVPFDGWSGSPWAKEGWFEAHRLLAPALDGAAREAMDDTYARLVRGETLGLAERADLERRLVAALTHGCGRMVVGYTAKEEFFDAAYPEIEPSP